MIETDLSEGSPDEDEQRFEQFMHRTSQAVARRLRSAVSMGIDIEGVMQEAYIRALWNWAVVDKLPEHKEVAWLSTTAWRLVLDELDKPERRWRSPNCATDGLSVKASDVLEPAVQIEVRERFMRVCFLIQQLPSREQDVMIRYSLIGDDYDTIARDLGITKVAVTTAISRARARLRSFDSSSNGQEG